MDDFLYIDTPDTLEKMCRTLNSEEYIAVDTEFIREKSYFSKLALIQIAGAGEVYCIDTVAINDLSSLFSLFDNPSITKIFHAAGQDLETLYHQQKRVPMPVFDTQVAAALLGLGEQMGYGALVKKVLGVELKKGASRTDWLKRPLSDEQLRYAADDVRYLIQLYPVLLGRLNGMGRGGWIESELRDLGDLSRYQPDFNGAWMKVKGAGKLKPQRLNILKHVAMWREKEAMKRDCPKRWLLSDEALMEMTLATPKTIDELNENRFIKGRISKKMGSALLAVIEQAQKESPSKWPKSLNRSRPTPQEEATLDALMAVCRFQAEKHQLSLGQITSRGELLRMIQGERDVPLLKGWRIGIVGQFVLDALAGKYVLKFKDGLAEISEAKSK